MSIASEIQRLSGVRSDIFTSITNKGVTVPETATFSSCPDLIDSIETTSAPNCVVNTAYTAQATGTTTIPFTASQIAAPVYTTGAMNLPFSANYFGEGEGGWNLTKRQIIELSSKHVSAVILADACDYEWDWNRTLYLNYGNGHYVYFSNAYSLSSDYMGTSATITIPASGVSGIFYRLDENMRDRPWDYAYNRWTTIGMDEVFGTIHPPAWETQYFENNPPTANWVSADVAGTKITSATNPSYNQMSQWGSDFNIELDNSFADIFNNLSGYQITFKLSSDSIGLSENSERVRFSYSTNSGDDFAHCGTWEKTQTDGSVFEITGTISGFGNEKKPATYPVYLNFPYTNNYGGTAQPLNGVVEFTYLSGVQIVYPYPGYAPTTTGTVVISGDGKYKFQSPYPYYCSATRTNEVTYADGPSTSFNDTKSELTESLNRIEDYTLKPVVTSYDTTAFTATGYNYQWGNATTSYSSNLNIVG